jgi:hypothetical protein
MAMRRAALLAAMLLALMALEIPALALELGVAATAAQSASGAAKTPTLRALLRELGRWDRRVNGQATTLALEVDGRNPLRLDVSAPRGDLKLVVGEAFLRDEALFRTVTAFVLGFSRSDRYGSERWIQRLGLGGTTVWKHYYGARHFAEVVFNADAGSALGRADVVEFWRAHLETALGAAPAGRSRELLQSLLDAQRATLGGLAPALEEARRRQASLGQRVRRRASALARARGGERLERMIASDQRGKVADLLEAIVPLAELEPFERAFWQQQLGAIRRDPAGEPRQRLYRGLYSGARYSDGKTVLAPALRDSVETGGSPLRALASYFEQRATSGSARIAHPGVLHNFRYLEKQHTSPSVNAMIANHSQSSSASCFISFGDLDIASRFAKGQDGRQPPRLGVYDVPRGQVLVPSHPRWPEGEFLKFLFVFPSDTVGVVRSVSRAQVERLGPFKDVRPGDELRLRSEFNRATLAAPAAKACSPRQIPRRKIRVLAPQTALREDRISRR